MDAKEIERQLNYRKLLRSKIELDNKYNALSLQYKTLLVHQENAIKKEVNSRTAYLEKEYEKELTDKNLQIEALKKEVAKLTSKMNNNSSNSGVPTSKTQIGNKKLIPNTREKTEKLIGGQQGHKKHKLRKFKEEEINETITVLPKACPKCKSEEIEIVDIKTTKDETDYDVKVIKRRYSFPNCKCNKCNNSFYSPIPNNLKEENQYGITVQSMAVCLTNEIYTPFNKTVKLIRGITKGK